jgi:hypothetical protein
VTASEIEIEIVRGIEMFIVRGIENVIETVRGTSRRIPTGASAKAARHLWRIEASV